MNKNRIDLLAGFIPSADLNDELIEPLEELKFFEMPASTKYHGAYEGGLFDHSLRVAQRLVELTEKLDLKWERPESPYIVGILHDLCKCDNYNKPLYYHSVQLGKDTIDHYEYRNDIIIPGHGEKSVLMAQKIIDLTDEEIACIRWHMGAYEIDTKMWQYYDSADTKMWQYYDSADTKMWQYYDSAIRKYPNVLYTHTADMIASKIDGV